MGARSLLLAIVSCSTWVYGDSSVNVTKDREFPFQVSIRGDSKESPHLCSGVLITAKSVLSSASCIPGEMKVFVSSGSIYLSQQNQKTYSWKMNFHSRSHEPGYGVVIITLKEPFKLNEFTKVVKMPVQGALLVNGTRLSDWEKVSPDNSLKIVQNYTVWKSQCTKRFLLDKELDENLFCGVYKLDSENGLTSRGALLTKDGVIYGMQNYIFYSKNMRVFSQVSGFSNWVKEALGDDASNIEWHTDSLPSNSGTSLRGYLVAVLVFAACASGSIPVLRL